MKIAMRVLLLLVVGLMLSVGHASAIPYGFYNISATDADNAASGELQLSMRVEGAGTKASFTFLNTGVSSITDIYFQDPTPSILNYAGFEQSLGVKFTVGATPMNLPGPTIYQFTANHSYDSASGRNGTSGNGVTSGEWLRILFNLSSGSTFDDVIAALDDASLRVGLHVQSFSDGGSESFINEPNNPVPEPGTMVLLGAGFLGLAIYGKRRKNS